MDVEIQPNSKLSS